MLDLESRILLTIVEIMGKNTFSAAQYRIIRYNLENMKIR
jgi:hypothetical protein